MGTLCRAGPKGNEGFRIFQFGSVTVGFRVKAFQQEVEASAVVHVLCVAEFMHYHMTEKPRRQKQKWSVHGDASRYRSTAPERSLKTDADFCWSFDADFIRHCVDVVWQKCLSFVAQPFMQQLGNGLSGGLARIVAVKDEGALFSGRRGVDTGKVGKHAGLDVADLDGAVLRPELDRGHLVMKVVRVNEAGEEG